VNRNVLVGSVRISTASPGGTSGTVRRFHLEGIPGETLCGETRFLPIPTHWEDDLVQMFPCERCAEKLAAEEADFEAKSQG
jgi:hypothetical protein